MKGDVGCSGGTRPVMYSPRILPDSDSWGGYLHHCVRQRPVRPKTAGGKHGQYCKCCMSMCVRTGRGLPLLTYSRRRKEGGAHLFHFNRSDLSLSPALSYCCYLDRLPPHSLYNLICINLINLITLNMQYFVKQ